MTGSLRFSVVYGVGIAVLSLVLSGCTGLAGRKNLPPPVVRVPSPPPQVKKEVQVKEEVPEPEGVKIQQIGVASWYGAYHHGRKTASGETFDQNKLTAAHRTLPLGTEAVVTCLETGKSVEVSINDRGPYIKGRKIDLSRAAAEKIGMVRKGLAKVKIEATLPEKSEKKTVRQKTGTGKIPVARRTSTGIPLQQISVHRDANMIPMQFLEGNGLLRYE